MATCDKTQFSSYEHGRCTCVADGTYSCADGQVFHDTGSAAATQDTIAAQDRARSGAGAVAKNWAPWLIGGVLLGGGLYLLLRD